MKLNDLIPILQMAIGPVILISGIGLLLLSMTNRLGRVIDRSRILSEARQKTAGQPQGHLLSQLGILQRRARLIRLSIGLATFSLLMAAILVIALFLAALFQLEIGLAVACSFVVCMGSLVGSLVVFLRDINLALEALKLDIEGRE